ncbi:DNA-3-methyladenine glycosylase family protein [Companilactobacillus kimchiensis]|nr:DNA-3-methyladenine glycosylase [Companilactobacillus kimchiensis]
MKEMKHLDKYSPEIKYLCQKDKHLAKVIQMIGPLDYYLAEDGYAFLVSQIIGQMLSNKVADVLTNRLTDTCHGKITLAEIDQLTDVEIHELGLSRSKVSYIRNLNQAVKSGTIDFDKYREMSDNDVINSLTTVKGIGNWSAKMYLLFSLDRPNVLPFEDLAFLQSYGWVYKTDDYTAKTVQKKCLKWSPYTSIAARYMYEALNTGLTKEPFHLFK